MISTKKNNNIICFKEYIMLNEQISKLIKENLNSIESQVILDEMNRLKDVEVEFNKLKV